MKDSISCVYLQRDIFRVGFPDSFSGEKILAPNREISIVERFNCPTLTRPKSEHVRVVELAHTVSLAFGLSIE